MTFCNSYNLGRPRICFKKLFIYFDNISKAPITTGNIVVFRYIILLISLRSYCYYFSFSTEVLLLLSLRLLLLLFKHLRVYIRFQTINATLTHHSNRRPQQRRILYITFPGIFNSSSHGFGVLSTLPSEKISDFLFNRYHCPHEKISYFSNFSIFFFFIFTK